MAPANEELVKVKSCADIKVFDGVLLGWIQLAFPLNFT